MILLKGVLLTCVLFLVPLPTFAQQDPGSLDVSLFRRINNGRSHFLDKVVEANNSLVAPVAIATPLGFLFHGILVDNQDEVDAGTLLAVSEIISSGVGYGLKRIVKRDRPYVRLANVHFSSDESVDRYSFPSGHATSAFAIATSLSLRYPKFYVFLPLHLWAFFVAYGRVYLGVHYPSDVLTGAALGSGTAIVVHLFREDILRLKRKILGGSGDGDTSTESATLNLTPVKGGFVFLYTYRF